jgi:hypothetical protein
MPPKKADKVPRRARAHGRAPARGSAQPGHGTGLKVIGASMVVLAIGVGWLSNLGGDGTDRTTLPYRQEGVTTIAGGEYRHLLPSSRAAVPVPFGGANTMVTVDDGLVTTTTTTAAPGTTGTSAGEDPARVWVTWEPVGQPGGGRPGGGGSQSGGGSATTRPTTTTTTRPTTTTSSTSTSTSTTSTTSTSTTSTSTTTTTEPTTTTTEPDGSTTTEPHHDGR